MILDNLEYQKLNNEKFGLTSKGFRRKLYSDCLQDRIDRARRVFGVNIDTSETSFLGELIRNASWDEAYLWELAENVYLSPFVNSAEGSSLDNVGQYLTITRRPATKSKGIITIYGDDNTIVDKGFKVATKNGLIFETLEPVEINGGQVDVPIASIIMGKGTNVDKETITEIVNPTFGVDRVTNVKETKGGMDVETDKEFRERYKKSYSRVGGSTVPAMTAALLDIDSVVDCEVRENVTMAEVDGIPPKSVACYVYGGEDDDIIQAIYENKPAGIEAFGTTVKTVKDKKGNSHKIGFTRAKVQKIHVKVKVTKDENYKGDDVVKRSIISYIGGYDADGVEYTGLKLGEDVVYSKLLGKIMCPDGVKDVDLSISKTSSSGDYVKANIEIPRDTIAVTEIEIIEVSTNG